MTTEPQLETVLTVVRGRSLLGFRKFKWGEAIPQFSVGLQGDWIVSGAGVARIHLLLTFDGRQIHAASVNGVDPVCLQDTPINDSWNPVAVGSELSFGDAKIVVSCQPEGRSDRPSRGPADERSGPVAALPAVPVAGAGQVAPGAAAAEARGTQLMADYRAELERQRRGSNPAPVEPFEAAAVPLRVLSAPATATAVASSVPDISATRLGHQSPQPNERDNTLPLADGPAEGGASPRPAVVVANAEQVNLSSTVPLTPPAERPGVGPGFTSGLAPAQPPAVLVGPSGMPTVAAQLSEPNRPAATLDAPLLMPQPFASAGGLNMMTATIQSPASTEAPCSTVSDGGALREFAAQIPPSPPDPDLVLPASPRPAAGSRPETAQPTDALHQPARTTPPNMLAAQMESSDGGLANALDKPPGTSLVKKLTLGLLPIAGGLFAYGMLFADDPAAESGSASSAAAQGAPLARAKAASPAASAATMPTTAATGSAVAVASAATARTTEVPATKAPSDVSNSATAAAVAAAPADPESAKASRKALDTAFEGRLTEAATQYQALAKSSEQQVYALAARHMQQGSVRVP